MNRSDPKSIAIYYPVFLGGGAEAVCLWILEALQHRHHLTLFTIVEPDLAKLNRMYGTQLNPDQIRIQILLPSGWSSLTNSLIANSQTARMLLFHALIRLLKAQKDHHDLLVSAYNAVDLGKPGIQYVHWIKVLEGNALYEKISDFSLERLKQNLFLTNSATVADYIRSTYEQESTIVYPPVVLDSPQTDWEQKENAFICSGRLTAAKEPHKVIKILRQVRARGFDVKLHLTGGGGGAYAWKYQRFLKQMVSDNADWVTLHENLSYADYVGVLSNCRYGIHYKQEPFGISIAEMVKAGALPFVRSRGGQVEIVGAHNAELLFANEAEAVERIVEVLADPAKQTALQTSLAAQRDLFSTGRFMAEFNQVVDAYFQSSQTAELIGAESTGVEFTGTDSVAASSEAEFHGQPVAQ
jgi:glycosyltransferase involved in cell wall biosynthesis